MFLKKNETHSLAPLVEGSRKLLQSKKWILVVTAISQNAGF
jgi:hypothetical protein